MGFVPLMSECDSIPYLSLQGAPLVFCFDGQMAEAITREKETAFVPAVFFTQQLTAEEREEFWLSDPSVLAKVVSACETNFVDTVYRAQDLGKDGFIELGVPRFGALKLATKIGMLQGGRSTGYKRTVPAHTASLVKKPRVDTSEGTASSLLLLAASLTKDRFRSVRHFVRSPHRHDGF